MRDPDIVVLRQKIHGLSAEEYAETLRERLPDREVALANTPTEERDLLSRARVATGFTLAEDVLETAANLDLFACVFAGTGHLPLEALEANDIVVTNASGVHGPNIAEQVLGSILYFTRRFHVAERHKQDNRWQSYPTHELQGSTVTVVGLGAIGQAVVDRLEPFGVDTIGVRYSPEKGGPTDEVVGFDDEQGLHDAFARSEYVVIACPLTDATRGLVDADAFKSMAPETVLVNIGRGPVVDTEALVSALRNNGIRGAALDVTDPEPLPSDHELWNFDNVLITPHNAGHTPKYWERMADIIAENLGKLDEGDDDLRNRVV
ncbi:D-2-hydroxyacid dehydrogenase [Haloferax mediterranei ATCC 33500]|uniref:2-hydroxyacid dehydrogenase n=2 Tax=Haloferax mediterranei TaxID=2252 RepID=I3R7Y6_HALMT|nr:D-2-hydroxyacid dehydrogenase [Haloferax mediterranei]AFK20346.1 D-3-phosphoglycerate dehydrogenase [Haloferax mediterranei ATCC 33500]AHZ23715.1 2-hydroxyacid dehydrogenase [Haloferax mediterranei ATCC 33500]ELZ99203.1 D-3-phosphoglycerate dehydrogenase [Haloferax mediterranei ATCC 33500]MDX5986897.1 D-2-hydroxyacid dehydrogenase [Haloferax mediterranei ATCC 33500]QCQ76219.1 D-2-hydroxyacid dehydrogenase [Haloferax mediterranei ATCC 33500]